MSQDFKTVLENPHYRDKIIQGAEFSEVTLKQEQVEGLLLFLSELLKWNKVYNLTGIKSIEDNIVKNLFDSLAVLPHIDAKNILDIGTGAGFPGMVLAIVKHDWHWSLLDSNGKKTRFLNQVKGLMNLKHVKVENTRIEALKTEQVFDGICSRAFDTIPSTLQGCEANLKAGTRFYGLKGKLLPKDIDDLPVWAEVEEIIPLKVASLDAERHLVKIMITQKINDTSINNSV